MENPYFEYYTNQAGYGISGFSGQRYQRGRGFFSKVFSNALFPFLKVLGQNVLNSGYDLAKDAAEGVDFKRAVKRRLTEAGINMAEVGLNRARQYAQTGTGNKRRRVTKVRRKKIKKRKRQYNNTNKYRMLQL